MNTTILFPNQIFKTPADVLIIPVINNRLPQAVALTACLPEIKRHMQVDEFKEAGACVFFYPHKQTGLETPKRIALLNFGKEKLTPNFIQQTLAKLTAHLNTAENFSILIPDSAKEIFIAQSILNLNKPSKKSAETKLSFFGDKKLNKILAKSSFAANAINLVKKLANLPANQLTPTLFAHAAKEVAKQSGLKFTALDEAQMQKLSMGGVLGVSRGSAEAARLIVVEYNQKAKKTIALAGKGITFDSGGISIKHSKGMHAMKHDMIGGACVLALVQLAAQLKLPYHIVGVIAASENLPSGTALKPGDVIKTYSSKTVEVLNTDAEGRLVLADALAYVQDKYQPKLTIDIATLTSGIIASLGNDITGVFGNNQKVNSTLLAASKFTGEYFHFMPLHENYKKELKSKVADFTNVGKQRSDAIFAALFLQKFIKPESPWLHLDIAGTAWDETGATGATMQTLIKFLETVKL